MSTTSEGNAASQKMGQPNRRRSFSAATFSIEELFPDDMGYDADIEVVRPSRYEEAETESDEEAAPEKRFHTIDEELADKMRCLGQEQTTTVSRHKVEGRGHKRTSREFESESTLLRAPLSPDLEVHEMVEQPDQPSPAKRRKRKNKRPLSSHLSLRSHIEYWASPSEKEHSAGRQREGESTTPTTASELPSREDDVEAMDVT